MGTISFDDYLAIHNLVAEYGLATDNADADAFMRCWVEPSEFGGYDSGSFGTMKTWQELYEFEKHHVGPGGMANGKRHESSNIAVRPVSATEAHVTCDLLVLEVKDEPRLIATGRYDDSVVVKTPKGWKFKKRKLHIDPGFFTLMDKMKAGKA